MKSFESFLKEKLEKYIIYRKRLGYSDKHTIESLLYFDRYIKNYPDNNSFNPSFFLKFRDQLNVCPKYANQIICAARGFFQFLVRLDYYTENPLKDIPAYKENAYIPFIFSHEQIDLFLKAIQTNLRKNERDFLNDFAVYIAILLLVRCGLRISEPLRILLTHYKKNERTIYIEKTKFNKDRLIPLPKSVWAEIENYLAIRKSLVTDDKNLYLLAGTKKNKLLTNKIYYRFHKAVKDIGINQKKLIIADTVFGAPTPHCLRHYFAINTLKQIKQRGKSPQDALPVLSAYMGHTEYKYTSLYLKVLDAEQRQSLVNFAASKIKKV